MIITRIKQQDNNQKFLTIAFRYLNRKSPLGSFNCDWNNEPNTLRISFRQSFIRLKFTSFMEACRFIFSMDFIEDAEQLQRKQNPISWKGENIYQFQEQKADQEADELEAWESRGRKYWKGIDQENGDY